MILKRLRINTQYSEQTNCYIVMDEETKECIVIDPGGEPEKIIEMINILSAKIKYIYLTHCHGDHISGVKKLHDTLGGKILIHRIEAENLYNPEVNLSEIMGIGTIVLEADSRIDDGDLLHVGNIEFQVIHTPGHTSGSTCLYCKNENMLFSGDTLFRGTWGRTDLPTSSFDDIINSINNKLMTLDDDTIVYPGHGKSTRIGEEKTIYLDLKPRNEY